MLNYIFQKFYENNTDEFSNLSVYFSASGNISTTNEYYLTKLKTNNELIPCSDPEIQH